MAAALQSLVPMAHVKSVSVSIEFYRRLGFEVGHTFVPEGAESPAWAWLESGDARMMLAAADEPVVASRQAVLLYPYGEEVQRARAELLASGVDAGTKMSVLGRNRPCRARPGFSIAVFVTDQRRQHAQKPCRLTTRGM